VVGGLHKISDTLGNNRRGVYRLAVFILFIMSIVISFMLLMPDDVEASGVVSSMIRCDGRRSQTIDTPQRPQ